MKPQIRQPLNYTKISRRTDEKFDFLGSISFISVHLIALGGIFFTGISWIAVLTGLALYIVRMWAITAGFHRYFSHRSYQTSRWFQFVLGFLGTSSAQMGPLWWAGHHRHHHRYSDSE